MRDEHRIPEGLLHEKRGVVKDSHWANYKKRANSFKPQRLRKFSCHYFKQQHVFMSWAHNAIYHVTPVYTWHSQSYLLVTLNTEMEV